MYTDECVHTGRLYQWRLYSSEAVYMIWFFHRNVGDDKLVCIVFWIGTFLKSFALAQFLIK